MSTTAEAAAALAAQANAALMGVIDEAVSDDEAEFDAPSVPAQAPVAASAPVQDIYEDEEPELPEDIAYLIDEDEELEEEFPYAVAEEEPEEDDEYTDPEVLKLRRELKAERKRAAHLEGLRAKDGQKLWRAEASKYFPYADLASVKGTSKRAYMRAAKASHESIKPHIKRLQEQERLKLREQAKKEGWGPAMNAGGAPPPTNDLDERIAKARKGGLRAVYREMIRGGA